MNEVQPIRDPRKISAILRYLQLQSDRNFMLFFTGIHTGLRISDLLRLRVRDVKGRRHLDIKLKKTGKRVQILIHSDLHEKLREYTETKDPRVFLFRSSRGGHEPLSRSGAYKILNKAARAVGLRSIGTHSLRKTFGYFYHKKHGQIGRLMIILGHKDQAHTLRYIGWDQDSQDRDIEGLDFGLDL